MYLWRRGRRGRERDEVRRGGGKETRLKRKEERRREIVSERGRESE